MQAARHEVNSDQRDAAMTASRAASSLLNHARQSVDLRRWTSTHLQACLYNYSFGLFVLVLSKAVLVLVNERYGCNRVRVPSEGLSTIPRQKPCISYIRFVAIVCLLILVEGCATLTIPAIDPSGNRIFAPMPTQLTLPQLHGPNGRNIVPNSSFPEPPPPAACLQGPVPATPAVQNVAIRSSDERGRCGQMLLTPTRIVAPVGGEVVLIAGVCGEDGYLVSGEPIEWMLAPDSVGEIIEVGDDMKGKRRSAWSKSKKPIVEKLDVDFARGRTSAEAGHITRGSLKPTDDLILKKGQTWVSLTSPTEGLSRVTVLAPESDVWDRRRQTATIYWIDASWQFPAPQNLRVGQIADLVTQVKRAEGFAPAEGWIVKYRIVNEGVGQFLTNTPGGGAGLDERVNSDAKAFARLGNPSNTPGTAIISIEIARPAQGSEKMPELPIARGQTMVTWSAPLLDLKVTASNDITPVGEAVDFRIVLSNAGDLAAENVRIKMELPKAGLQAAYADGFIPEQKSELGAIWEQGIIPARSILELPVRITPTAESDYRILFTAEASPAISVNAPFALLAVKPQIELQFAPMPGMQEVEVGQPAIFQVIAKNTGKTTLNGLSLVIDSDAGLQHAELGSNHLSQEIPYIPPGQSRELGVRFIVRKAGQLSATLVAQVGGLTIAERKAFVRGIEATPRQANMALQLKTQNGSTQIAPNSQVGVQGVVQNRGQTLLTNIQMLVEYDSSLELTQSSPGMNDNRQSRQLTWTIPSLEPGTQLAVEMIFRSNATSAQSAIRLTARSGEGINAQETLNLNSVPGSSGEPPVLPSTSPDRNVLPTPGSNAGSIPSAANNAWSLLIQPIDHQVNARQRAKYSVSFRNNQSQADQDVVLEFQIPQGVQVISVVAVDGTPINSARSDDGRGLRLEPIRSLRAGEAVGLILELQHDAPGAQILEVTLRSAADPQGVRQQSSINVRPNL